MTSKNLVAAVMSLGLVLASSFAHAADTGGCVADFHSQQKPVQHHLTPQQLEQLHQIVEQTYFVKNPFGQRAHPGAKVVPKPTSVLSFWSRSSDAESAVEPTAGWALLASWGDQYAQLAKTAFASESHDSKPFSELVKDHWANNVGQAAYNSVFANVARLHFKQYVEILQTGTWPDSDQIMNSFVAASRLYLLPDVAVFDSTWVDSGVSDVRPWTALVKLDPSRVVDSSRVCQTTHSLDALGVVAHDMVDLMF